jgi:glucose/arabinose dehydrogenase
MRRIPLLLGGVWTLLLCGVFQLFIISSFATDSKPGTPPNGPLTPKEELAAFRLPKGFQAELVACEPNVVDPVAIAFDEDGRLFVAEMRGYPNAGVATGDIHSGKIKLLEDRDGDGFYETSRTFAEGLRFPTSVMPWKGGLLVAIAPDIVYFEDTSGKGKADRHRTPHPLHRLRPGQHPAAYQRLAVGSGQLGLWLCRLQRRHDSLRGKT